jgi:Tol biopolymer transport system component
LLSWHILPIPHPELAVRAANRAKVAEPTGQAVSRAVANGRIAFVSGVGNAFTDIYTMNPDGSNVQRLTNNPAHNYFDPAWSPDGSKITFVRFSGTYNDSLRLYTDIVYEIFVMNADGSDQRRLTQSRSDFSPAWSPDGTKIAFWRIDSITMPSSWGIFVMNADGSDQRAVASTSNSDLQEPAWSPDGLKFAVVDNGFYRIYLINVDGSNRTQITQPPSSFEDHAPAWSPDGSKITFIRCADANGWGCWDTPSHLWVVNADGSNPTKLTDTQAYTPAWSPDGTKIIFSNGDLLVMNPDGSGLTNITNTDGKSEWSPSWQPLSLPAVVNPIDDPQFFVRQQYRDFLNREPEPAGLQFYLDILNGCQPADAECIKYTRGALSANFFRSPEFGRKGAYVANLFNIVIGQRPKTVAELNDPTKVERPHYGEFMADLATLSTLNDDPVLTDQKKEQLTSAWLARTEVESILPSSLSNQQFVQKLESIAGVTLANESTLIANLNNGSQTRAQVLRAIAESNEVVTKFYIPNFVTMEYLGYLRRDPEDCHISSDPENCGYIFHNRRFNTPGADPDLIENIIVRGFIESPEYRRRFGP